MHWTLPIVLFAIACGGDEKPDDSGEELGGPDRLLMEIRLSPEWAAPGDLVKASVTFEHQSGMDGEVSLKVNGEKLRFDSERSGKMWSGDVEFSAPLSSIDHLVSVQTPYFGGIAEGYRLLAVSERPECPSGEVRRGDGCHPRTDGSILGHNAKVILMNRYGQDRTMAHPRVTHQVGDKLVSCITDAMSVVRIDDLVDLDVLPSSNGPPPAATVPYKETLFKEIDLFHCDHMVFDESRDFAMVATRGNLGGPGGLSVWHYPDLDAQEHQAPIPVFVQESDPGFERLLWDGELLYGTQHPDSVVVMELSDEGSLTEIGRVQLEETLSIWSIAKDQDILYVTDAGDHRLTTGSQHNEEEHSAPTYAGRIHSIDVSDPTDPIHLDVAKTTGLGKGLAMLPEGIIAIGSGAAGIEIIDASDPESLEWLHAYDTPGLAQGVDYADGLLVTGDWNAISLFDVGDRGLLRLLDTDDFVREPTPPPQTALDPYGGLVGSGAVRIVGDHLIVNEWNAILYAETKLGGSAPRSVLLERMIRSDTDRSEPQPFSVRIHNGAREGLWVSGIPDEATDFSDNGLVIPPGGLSDLQGTTTAISEDDSAFYFETNAPDSPLRGVYLSRRSGTYINGDPAPSFELPSINHCENTSGVEPCEMEPRCARSTEQLVEDKPILLAFFSTW